MIKCTQCTFQMAKEKMQKISKIIQDFLTFSRMTLKHTAHMQTPTEKHKNKQLLMHTLSTTSTNTPALLRALNGTESAAQRFTSESSLVEALLDAVGSAHVEGLGDLLVHETLSVEDICHHHPQVKHLQQLRDGGDLHQISSALVQTARVQVLKHRLEPSTAALH